MLKNSKGITLIEVLMALALSGVVIALAVQVYITNSSSFKVSEAQARLISEAQYIQERLTTLGLQSQGIIEIKSGENNLLDKVDSADNVTLLTLQMDSTNSHTFNYDLSTKTLSLGSEELSKQVIAFKVVPVTDNTKYKDTKSVQVELTLESNQSRIPVEHETTTIITFRNK